MTRLRPALMALGLVTLLIANPGQADARLKRAMNVYPLPAQAEEDPSAFLKNVRKQVRGRKLVLEDGLVELSEPIRSIRFHAATTSLVIDANDGDFELLVEHVLDPLASAQLTP